MLTNNSSFSKISLGQNFSGIWEAIVSWTAFDLDFKDVTNE
jgi:hypothetical protein